MKKMPNLGDFVLVEFLGDGLIVQRYLGYCIGIRWKGKSSSFIITTKAGFQQQFLINSPFLFFVSIFRQKKKR